MRAWRWLALSATGLGLLLAPWQAGAAQSSPLPVRQSRSWLLPASPPAPTYTAVAFPETGDGLLGETVPARRPTARVLQTKDDGRTWRVVWRGSGTAAAFSFGTAEDGWLLVRLPCAGQTCPSRLFATQDGGGQWRPRTLPQGDVLDVDLAGAELGYALTRQGPCQAAGCGTRLWRSEDGGEHWQLVTVPYLIVSGLAAEGDTVLAAGLRCERAPEDCRARILRSQDAGRSWTPVLLQAGGNYQGNSGPFSVSLRAGTAWAEGPVPGGGSMASGIGPLYRSTNSGRTWVQVAPAFGWGGTVQQGGPGFAEVPVGGTAQTAFALVGTGAGAAEGGIALTWDAGRHWTRLLGLYGRQVSAAAWDGPSTLWVAGFDPALSPAGSYLLRLKLGPAGDVWTRQALPKPSPLELVAGPSPGTLFGLGLASDPGAVLRSQDGGRTWTVLGSIPDAEVLGGQFLPEGLGFAYGRVAAGGGDGEGALWATRDGGRHWRLLAQGAYALSALSFSSAERGLRAIQPNLDPDTLWQVTSDGGRTWRTVARLPWPFGRPLVAWLAPASAFAWVVVAGRAELYRTEDEGRTWQALGVTTPTFPPDAVHAELTAAGPACVVLDLGSDLYVSRDGGGTWLRLRVQGGVVSAVALLPGCTWFARDSQGFWHGPTSLP